MGKLKRLTGGGVDCSNQRPRVHRCWSSWLQSLQQGRPLGNDLTLALHLYFWRGKAQKDLTNTVKWPKLIGRSAILSCLMGLLLRSHVLVLLDPFRKGRNGQIL